MHKTLTEPEKAASLQRGEPKSPSDELIRVAEPGRNKTTPYEAFLKYARVPRKKNARKRLGERIGEEWRDIQHDKKLLKEHNNKL